MVPQLQAVAVATLPLQHFQNVATAVKNSVEGMEQEVDYEEESREIGKKLKLDWDSLDKSWKMAMQRRAKKVRTCHEGHHKDCETCEWARKRAQREWEVTHPREVTRKEDSKGCRQSSMQ